ncbi:MAG: hypothetical protein U1E20_13705 [Methylocystis sp.]|uniref:hypothetical protein n=1 Tax=Methylocystis sp. TaxID=1911079 RepID=UPI003925C5D8
MACLARGLEAVLVPDYNGVVCASASRGRLFLDSMTMDGNTRRYPDSRQIKAEDVCAPAPVRDKRIVSRTFVKDLARDAKDKVDPKGIRIIGGVYCDGLDLSGLDLPYSIVFDKSIITCTHSTECSRVPVEIRNFQTKGDLSFDYAVSHVNVRITRSEIAGSLYSQGAFLSKLTIIDTIVHGTLNAPDSLIGDELTIENTKVDGDVDLARSFFSHLVFLKNHVGGALDLGQSHARCSFDIRKNELNDVVAVEFGFGDVRTSDTGEELFGFKAPNGKPGNAYQRFTGPDSQIFNGGNPFPKPCDYVRSIVPGSFVFIENHIKYSICLRDFSWLVDDKNRPEKSIIYLNEDIVDGATWLDIKNQMQSVSGKPDGNGPRLSIFNLQTGTFVLDFEVTKNDVLVSVNGLHFERVYSAKDKCETALSPRATNEKARPRDAREIPQFPPSLSLPKPEHVTAWVKKNEFKGTQPFAQFVSVFEQAGDAEAARELKIQGETTTLKRSICKSWGFYCESENDAFSEKSNDIDQSNGVTSAIGQAFQRMEDRLVALLQFLLWNLAAHGFRPERVVWFALGTLLIYWLVIQLAGVVGFSVIDERRPGESPRIQPIGLIFLFDTLIPGYKLREDHSKPLQFYVLADQKQATYPFKRFLKVWNVTEASERQQRIIKICFDLLRWLGLIFAIFLFAAIGRLVR